MIYKTYTPKISKDTEVKWYLFDAKDKVLGKLASEIAQFLTGKNSPDFSPHIVPRVRVVVINSKEISVTGRKESDKKYYRHSRYPGNLKEISLGKLMEKDGTSALSLAVKGMLPKNKLRKNYLLNLHIFADENHNKSAQKLIKVN